MPKKSAKKTKEGAEQKKTTRPKEKQNIKEYISGQYAHTARASKWLWTILVIFLAVIVFWWIWILKLQLTNLNWQSTQDQLTAKLRENWDQSFEQMRQEQSLSNQLQTAWNNIIANLPTSTVSSTISTSTATVSSTANITANTSTINTSTNN